MSNNRTLGFTYLGNLQQASYRKDVTEESEIHRLVDRLQNLNQVPQQMMPIVFAADYRRGNYLFLTENVKQILGYSVAETMEGGLEFMLNISNKNVFRVVNEKVFPVNVAFLKSIPQTDHKEYLFTFNTRLRKADGTWCDLLQKGTFITSKESGLPLYSIGMMLDITPFKRDSAVIQAIDKIDGTRGHQRLESNTFFAHEEDTILTKKETDVVKFMADGLSSKMIADRLGLSENTIANHRKNLLRKTNTKNTAQLIAFVAKNHLI